MIITHHAIERAVERIPGIQTEDQARTALSSTAIQLAIQIGAPFVKLGTGQHVVLRGPGGDGFTGVREPAVVQRCGQSGLVVGI